MCVAQGMVLVQLQLPQLVYKKLKRRSEQASVSMNRFVLRALRTPNMTKPKQDRRSI